MLYKMHLCREELAVIDAAMKDYAMLHDEQPEVTERAAQKVALLKDYVDLNAQVLETVQAKEKAKQAYKAYTFAREQKGPFSLEEPAS